MKPTAKDEDRATEIVGNFDVSFDLPRKLEEGLREEISQALAQERHDTLHSAEVEGLIEALKYYAPKFENGMNTFSYDKGHRAWKAIAAFEKKRKE